MKATYVSVWDGCIEITTSCNFNPETKNITDIEMVDGDGLDILEREFIRLPDGTEIDVEDCLIEGETLEERLN
jgi:hypothetical protein